MASRRHSADTVRQALEFLSPDIVRDDWVRIAMAIKSELDEAGFELFEEWSSRADSYDARATHSTWRSIKASGGVTIGTLFELAKAAGFKFTEGGAKRLTKADRARMEAKKRERDAAERARRQDAQRATAVVAQERWKRASPAGSSPYLDRKAVGAHGIRFEAARGSFLVPLCDVDGVLWNLQSITAAGGKYFLPDGRVSEQMHWIGSHALGTPAIVCEGYATGATLHEASGLAVAVAFNAGNLEKVACAIRARDAAAPLLIAADDDRETQERTGRNPGREGAEKAAARARGAIMLPLGLPLDGTDFNDLCAAHGRELVAELVTHTIAAAREALVSKESIPADREPAAQQADDSKDRFKVDAKGVWFRDDSKEDGPRTIWICSPLEVEAQVRDADSSSWGYLLAFDDVEGKSKRWALPARHFAGDGTEYRAMLLDLGLGISSNNRARGLLSAYIQSRRAEVFARCVERVGWHCGNSVYVLPDRTIASDEDERVILQTDERSRNPFTQGGSLEGWREDVAAYCSGNSRLLFAVSCAFAAPILRLLGVEGGGFHFRGASSSGKTTALRAAASVNGGVDYVQTWRTTANALEGIASQYCDALLPLDEMGQLDPKEVGDAAYLLANGQAKARLTRGAAMRARSRWSVLILSTGEASLQDLMAEARKVSRSGQEVRLVDVPADAGADHGMFEDLHGLADGSAFADRLALSARRQYGVAGVTFLERLVAERESAVRGLRERSTAIATAWTEGDVPGQVRRVASRFAIVAAAGELASEWEITPWERGEVEAAARRLFSSWIAQRGGAGEGEEIAIVRHVAAVLGERGEANFPLWHRAGDDHRPNAPNRWGFRKLLDRAGSAVETDAEFLAHYGDKMGPVAAENSGTEFYVLSAQFKTEVCRGFDSRHVAKVLMRRGHLLGGEKGRGDRRERLPLLGNARCYRIKGSIFNDDLL